MSVKLLEKSFGQPLSTISAVEINIIKTKHRKHLMYVGIGCFVLGAGISIYIMKKNEANRKLRTMIDYTALNNSKSNFSGNNTPPKIKDFSAVTSFINNTQRVKL